MTPEPIPETASDAVLEALIARSYRDYLAAPRERQKPLWAKVSLLTGERVRRQEQRAGK